MDDATLLNIWGGGQLFCFSGIDGTTDFEAGLVLRTRGQPMGPPRPRTYLTPSQPKTSTPSIINSGERGPESESMG